MTEKVTINNILLSVVSALLAGILSLGLVMLSASEKQYDATVKLYEGLELRIRSLEVGIAPATEDRITRTEWNAEKQQLVLELKEWADNKFKK
jgi:hypothetical protein